MQRPACIRPLRRLAEDILGAVDVSVHGSALIRHYHPCWSEGLGSGELDT